MFTDRVNHRVARCCSHGPVARRSCRSRMRPPIGRWLQRRAFTLLEITLAVAIMAMMALAIFRFVESNIISVRISSQTAAADARYDGLRELLLAQWQSLPPGKGALTGEPAKLEDRPRDEIRWT